MKTGIAVFALIATLSASFPAAGGPMTVTAVNKLSFARPNQTIELSDKDLAPLGEKDLARIHVKDSAGKDLLCQAVDTDGDPRKELDMVIFQADFAPGETRTFTVTTGERMAYTKDQMKAHGRFVRERFDDFAWENDRIVHRMYGKALETWVGEPLASSTVDIWSKRVPRMVIDDWYMLDTYAGTGNNYHADSGEGADFYSSGQTRGCGGNGLWAADRLWVSRNFVNSRVLANGPIRVMFELTYEPFEVDGMSVAETKRIMLDAGQQLNRFQSHYRPYPARPGQVVPLTMGVGLKKVSGESKELSAEHGWLAKWERMEKNAGNQGLAIIVDPRLFVKQTEDQRNLLMLVNVPQDNVASYWAGFCWDKAGPCPDEQAWKTYVDQFAQGLLSPIEISVSAQ